ncbi:hypothetical protein IH992_02835 [Candidatus Poribacteria bacterium]|nr:hypothetical protein [Candidatus Poribacteria bacterium]
MPMILYAYRRCHGFQVYSESQNFTASGSHVLNQKILRERYALNPTLSERQISATHGENLPPVLASGHDLLSSRFLKMRPSEAVKIGRAILSDLPDIQ